MPTIYKKSPTNNNLKIYNKFRTEHKYYKVPKLLWYFLVSKYNS